jgi:hypothetical protein
VLGALFCKPSPNLELIVSHITSNHISCRQKVRHLVDKVDDDDHLAVAGGCQERDQNVTPPTCTDTVIA